MVPGRGVVVPPGDADALARAVVELAGDSERRKTLGRSARAYAEEAYDAIMGRFEREAEAVVGGREGLRTELEGVAAVVAGMLQDGRSG